MNSLALKQFNVETIESREVARMSDKRHDHLVRDIEGYATAINQNPDLGSDQFFIESSYTSGTGKSYKCYLCTRKGCEMIANKMTGTKGIQFTAAYINMFHKMENAIKNILPEPPINVKLFGGANSAARNIRLSMKEAGVDPQQIALAVVQIYSQIGLKIPLGGMVAPKKTHDQTGIAKKLGVLSASGKPHAQAIGAILNKIDIDESEKELVPFNRNGHASQAYQYTDSVIDKISNWLHINGFPCKITGDGKAFGVQYSKQAV